jgi:CheY-like chemotaxis protein
LRRPEEPPNSVDTLPPTSSDLISKADKPFRILVVDDSSLQQKMMAFMLRKLGFNADIAENGHEAVKALERENYDVVFMDICMPGNSNYSKYDINEMTVMNGWQATREIKRKRGENTPFIVAATSNTEPDDKQRCLDAGMDSFIPKPIQLDEVRVILQAAKKIKEPLNENHEVDQRAYKKPYFG